MKNKISFFIIFIIIFLMFFLNTCSENGVECGLTGKWDIVDLEFDNSSNDVDDVEGLLEITYNDIYELDMEYNLENGFDVEMDDYGELKACAMSKYIQFFSDDDDGETLQGNRDSLNCTYILNGSDLTIYNDDFTMELVKTYQ